MWLNLSSVLRCSRFYVIDNGRCMLASFKKVVESFHSFRARKIVGCWQLFIRQSSLKSFELHVKFEKVLRNLESKFVFCFTFHSNQFEPGFWSWSRSWSRILSIFSVLVRAEVELETLFDSPAAGV